MDIVCGPGAVSLDQTVKITPLGARMGEFCSLDRALLFEDPSGVRILYDPGFTVAGGDDSRLGDVHARLSRITLPQRVEERRPY